jgi:hypothetical protein
MQDSIGLTHGGAWPANDWPPLPPDPMSTEASLEATVGFACSALRCEKYAACRISCKKPLAGQDFAGVPHHLSQGSNFDSHGHRVQRRTNDIMCNPYLFL